jgi:hypothetical protein
MKLFLSILLKIKINGVVNIILTKKNKIKLILYKKEDTKAEEINQMKQYKKN